MSHRATQDADPGPAYWHDLRPRWPTLPQRRRREILRAAADAAYRAWQAGAGLAGVPLDLVLFESAHPGARWPGTRAAVPSPSRRVRAGDLLDALADWHIQTRDVLSARDACLFLRRLLRPERLDPAALKSAAREVAELAESRSIRRAGLLYRRLLEESRLHARGPAACRGLWMPGRVPASELARAVEAAEQDPASVVFKQSQRVRVIRASLLGHDVVIKRQDTGGVLHKLIYRFRASHGRRAWATGRAFRRLGIPTPEPLGFLEVRRAGTLLRSYDVRAFVPDAQPVSRWLNARAARLAPAERGTIRRELAALLLQLYRHGIHHRDAKLLNLLVRRADGDAARTYFWIDLECVRFDTPPTRHRVIRNLVQMNGSLRARVPEGERLAFLQDLARRYPWAADPRTVREIRDWTRRRLLREIRFRCGS